MTNKERYQRTFSALHASEDFLMEVTPMKRTGKVRKNRIAALCAAIALIAVLATAAYAADVGGIRRTVQLWVHGDQTDAVMVVEEDGCYKVTYEDENGDTMEMGGGGIAIGENGVERPLTEEEILEHLNEPQVEYKDDGTAWVYCQNQKLEITDKFDDDGVCYVQVKNGGKTMYLTIQYQEGYSMSPHGFEKP